jgi:hypothetical protein
VNSTVAGAASFGGSPRRAIRVLRWRGFPNAAGTVLGSLDIELPSGLQILDLRLGIGERGGRYITPPRTQMPDRDDRILLDVRGRPRWHAFIDFRDRQVRERFSGEVLAALRSVHPELFAGEGGQ